jgi:iron(III) transport system ATP-binding protein
MAMSDRILLLNNGVIEQQGTPQQMYGHPATLFAADFMGSNNRIEGRLAETRGGMALLAGDGWRLWGERKGAAADGASQARATGMVRLESVRVTDAGGDNRVKLPLVTSMYLGDRWEHLFHLGDMRLRAYGPAPLPAGEHWLEIPRDDLWIF